MLRESGLSGGGGGGGEERYTLVTLTIERQGVDIITGQTGRLYM